MNRSDDLKPLVLHRSFRKFCLLFPAPFILITLLLCIVIGYDASVITEALLCITGLTVLMSLTLLLISCFSPRITISAEGLVCEPRCGPREEYLWCNYHYLYELHGRKQLYLLLSSSPLDKAAQLSAFHACRPRFSGRAVWDAAGLLLLDPWLSEKEILRRLPAHIRIVPKKQCARLLDP